MTRTAAKDILINRIDFRVTGASPVSGRYFEGEHSIVTLDNIRECQPKQNITDLEFTDYLTQIKTDTIYQLLADVFISDEIPDDLLDCYPALFDNCISILMTIRLIEMFVTSSQSNRTQRITKSAAQQIHFDLNGNYGKDSNPNFPRSLGIASKYKEELKKLKSATGTQKMFVSITTK